MKFVTSESWGQQDADRFGSVLVRLRVERNYSQRDLSKLAGLSPTTISNLEGGKKSGRPKPIRPTANTIGKLARGLATDNLNRSQQDPLLVKRNHDELMQAAGYGPSGIPDSPKFQSPIPAGVSIDELTDDQVRDALEAYDRHEGVSSLYAGDARDWRNMSSTGQRLVLESREQARIYAERIEEAERQHRARRI